MNYYGDKISNNIIVTDEGYLVCMNVPIGRIGYMDYLGQELPAEFNLPFGQTFKVRRTAEELFRPETIASADRVLVMEQGRIVQELRPQAQAA